MQLGNETLNRNVTDWALDGGNALVEVLNQELAKEPVVVMDETPLTVLESKGQGVSNLRKQENDSKDGESDKKEHRNKDYIAVQATPFNADRRIIRVVYLGGRTTQAIEAALEGFHPKVLVTDDYQVYASFCRGEDAPKQQNCCVHLRRMLLDAINIDKINEALFGKTNGQPNWEALRKAVEIICQRNQAGSAAFHLCSVIDAFSKIYGWEKSITRKKGESSESYLKQVQKMRQKHCQPLMDNIDKIMQELAETYTELTPAGKYKATDNESMYSRSVTYYMNQREAFRTFLTDPRVPLDSNSAELAVRPLTVLRKATDFKQTVRGTKALCVLLTLHETGKANGIRNISRWLREFGCAYNKYREEKTLNRKIRNLTEVLGQEQALKCLDTKLMAYDDDAGEGFDFTPWLPWNYKN